MRGGYQAWALPPGFDPDGAEKRVTTTAPGVELTWLLLAPTTSTRLLGSLEAAGRALVDQPVADVARALGHVGARFADARDPLRREALELLPAHAGVSTQQARWTLDGMARDWTEPRLRALLAAEFGDERVLDGFRTVGGDAPGRRLRAIGPTLALHVTAGSVPGVSVTSLIRGLLVKGAVLLKPGAGDAVLPVLFARGLADAPGAGPALAAATAVTYWPGGTDALEAPALAAAGQVVVYGDDATVSAVRGRLGVHQRLVAYPHRISTAVVGPNGLRDPALMVTAGHLARAVTSFDQRGCVCPHQVFLPGVSTAEANRFARALAAALDGEAERLPPGRLDANEASAVQQLRGAAEMRAAAGHEVTVYAGSGLNWTVVVDAEPRLAEACLARTVHVTPVASVAALGPILAPWSDHLQSVGVAGFDPQGPGARGLGELLARSGATRIAPLSEIPFPPPWWRHDGRGPLSDLVRWVEWQDDDGVSSREAGGRSSPDPA